MKLLQMQAILMATAACFGQEIRDPFKGTLEQQLRGLAVVAEVRIEWIRVQRAPGDKYDDLFCECVVLQGFKLPVATNRLILRLNFSAVPLSNYEGKTAILFASENKLGGFTPYWAKSGLIMTNEVSYQYFEVEPDKTVVRKLKYQELLQEIKRVAQTTQRDSSEPTIRANQPELALQNVERAVRESDLIVVAQFLSTVNDRKANAPLKVLEALKGSAETTNTIAVGFRANSLTVSPPKESKWVFFMYQPVQRNRNIEYRKTFGRYDWKDRILNDDYEGIVAATGENIALIRSAVEKIKTRGQKD